MNYNYARERLPRHALDRYIRRTAGIVGYFEIHGTLRMTRGIVAGVAGRLWQVSDLVALWGS